MFRYGVFYLSVIFFTESGVNVVGLELSISASTTTAAFSAAVALLIRLNSLFRSFDFTKFGSAIARMAYRGPRR